jgi:sterol desaturase/sphingolipid hydroxylase (fatty acid hydroxylase superfamily)
VLDALKQLLLLTASLAALIVVFAILERRFGLAPQARLWSRSRRLDLWYCYFTPIVVRALLFGALSLIVLLVALASGLPRELVAFSTAIRAHAPLHALPAAAQLAVLVVLGDFLRYWVHRLFHVGWWWKSHAVHHGAVAVDWLSSVRFHPLNELFNELCMALVLVFLGIDFGLFLAVAPFLQLWAFFVHANLPWSLGPIGYVLTSPRFHRWHHTADTESLDKNFASLFSTWDLIFGTYYLPKGRDATRFGVSGESVPEDFLGQLAYPFRRPERPK